MTMMAETLQKSLQFDASANFYRTDTLRIVFVDANPFSSVFFSFEITKYFCSTGSSFNASVHFLINGLKNGYFYAWIDPPSHCD